MGKYVSFLHEVVPFLLANKCDPGIRTRMFDRNKLPLSLQNAQSLDVESEFHPEGKVVNQLKVFLQDHGKNLTLNSININAIQNCFRLMLRSFFTEVSTELSWLQGVPEKEKAVYFCDITKAYIFRALTVWFQVHCLEHNTEQDETKLQSSKYLLWLLQEINIHTFIPRNFHLHRKQFLFEKAEIVCSKIIHKAPFIDSSLTKTRALIGPTKLLWLIERVKILELTLRTPGNFFFKDDKNSQVFKSFKKELSNTLDACFTIFPSLKSASEIEMMETELFLKLIKKLEEIYISEYQKQFISLDSQDTKKTASQDYMHAICNPKCIINSAKNLKAGQLFLLCLNYTLQEIYYSFPNASDSFQLNRITIELPKDLATQMIPFLTQHSLCHPSSQSHP